MNKLKKAVGYGSDSLCGRLCHTIQDDAAVWNDLSLCDLSMLPNPPPAIPKEVLLVPSPPVSLISYFPMDSPPGYDEDALWLDNLFSALPTMVRIRQGPISCLELEGSTIPIKEDDDEMHRSRGSGSTSEIYRKYIENENFDGCSYSSSGTKGSASFFHRRPRKIFPRTSPKARLQTQSHETASTGASTTLATTSVGSI
jgi:hypothetical protein